VVLRLKDVLRGRLEPMLEAWRDARLPSTPAAANDALQVDTSQGG